MRVSCVIVIEPEKGESKPSLWNKFFQAHPSVLRVRWAGSTEACHSLVLHMESGETVDWEELPEGELKAALRAINAPA